MFYWSMKYVFLGPVLHAYFRPKPVGLENVPTEGPAIIAGNHVSPLDTVLLPLVVPHRNVVFLAKAEYFQSWKTRWFFKGAGTIPIFRGGTESGAALQGAVDGLKEGKLIGIFPEGTRSPDGRMYRGKTGVARLALSSGVPVIPVGVQNTHVPSLRRTVVRFGEPLDFSAYAGAGNDRDVLRHVTDEVMAAIQELSGQRYVDAYATGVKAALREGRSVEAAEVERPGLGRAAPPLPGRRA